MRIHPATARLPAPNLTPTLIRFPRVTVVLDHDPEAYHDSRLFRVKTTGKPEGVYGREGHLIPDWSPAEFVDLYV